MNVQQITEAIRAGKTLTQLAAETGIPRGTLASRLSRAYTSANRIKRDRLRADGLKMLERGLSLTSAAKALGVKQETLQAAVPEYPVNQHEKLTPAVMREVERLRLKAVPINIIADRIGVTKDAIYKKLRGTR